MNLIDIFNDTKLKSLNINDDIDKSIDVYTSDELNCVSVSDVSNYNNIYVVNGGTVNTGYKLSFYGNQTVAILNFANGIFPGGFVEYGSHAQEECICRSTSLFKYITSKKANELFYSVNKSNYSNGLCTDNVLYTRDVAILKDDTTYEDVPLSRFDVITCPAPCCELDEKDALDVYLHRITNIVISAIKNDVDILVLGAWGCGAFGNNPILVAQAFARVLNTYNVAFNKIVFSFVDELRDVFIEQLEKYYLGEVKYDL